MKIYGIGAEMSMRRKDWPSGATECWNIGEQNLNLHSIIPILQCRSLHPCVDLPRRRAIKFAAAILDTSRHITSPSRCNTALNPSFENE